jgi:hypothetical protein
VNAYVLVWRPTKVWLIGPFANADLAYRWAADDKNNPSDDPNWFILPLLRDPGAPLEVVPPIVPMPDSAAIYALANQYCERLDEVDDDGLSEIDRKWRWFREQWGDDPEPDA